jgi:hypothetical protein
MITLLRFASAAWTAVFALPATAWAQPELHALEAYEGGSKQAEDQFINFLGGFFGRPAGSEDILLRGTHAVGTCTEADVEIRDIKADADVPDEFAVGVFAKPRTFNARVRFSNGLGTPSDASKGFDDKDYDARAMAIQIRDAEGQRQDFVLQNSPIFPIWPVQGFALTVQMGIAKAEGRLEEFMGQLDADQRRLLSNVLDHVRRYQRSPGVVTPTFTRMPDAYRLETYWSGKAHQLGVDGVPVKYIAKPCNSNGTHVPTKAVDFAVRKNNFLQEELTRHLDSPLQIEKPACFGFYLQPLKAEAMTGPDGRVLAEGEHWKWVEDTTLEWKETEAPAYQIGKITLKGPVLASEICDDPSNFINSSINTLPQHEGLGRISRAETVAAKASIERRAGGGSGDNHGPDYSGGAIYLDQGWDHETTQWWYHVSQGTVFMPYAWFLALEQPVGAALFSAPGHLERLGFFSTPPNEEYNPDGLPVGFSKRALNLDQAPYGCWQGEWVGFTCAACHTGQLNYHGQEIRLQAGPAHTDIEALQDELARSLAATAASRPKFGRFTRRVMDAGATTDPQDLAQRFRCYVGALGERTSFFEAAQANAAEEPTAAGSGRLDALGRGGNLLLAAPLGEPKNYIPNTAPVSFPALWDTPYFDWVLYNVSVRQPLARNVVEALGVGAPIDPSTILAETVVHGLEIDKMADIQDALMDVRSPRWPENVVGPIDQAKAEHGEAIYNKTCAACHQVIDPATHRPVEQTEGNGGTSGEITIPSFALDKIGTDPRQAVNFANRMLSFEKIGGPAEIPLKDAAKLLTDKIVTQWIEASPENARRAEEVNRGRTNEFQAVLEYRARPLNGIWATPPYLHNGSVPSLYQLLLPTARRDRIFFTGDWEFDPKRVGVGTTSPFPGATVFDTRLPGNSNAGHEYGAGLNDADRMALIEYLKTL